MRKLEVGAAVAAAVVAIVTLIVLAYQTLQSANALKATEVTTQVQYNLQVMEQLDKVLVDIAQDKTSASYVWGPLQRVRLTDASVAMQNGDSLLDVLSMALKGVNCIPHFSTNGVDWIKYVRYVMGHSENLKQRVIDEGDTWPEIAPYAGIYGLPPTKCA